MTELAWIGYWLLANGGGASGYRVTVIGWIAVMLAWGTVAGHALRIARSNPVLALRYE